MEFELTAGADAVATLARLKALTGSRDGRPRSQAVKIVWHDNPEHALAADGLTMSEQRGQWRMERTVPGTGPWLPAQPAPVVAEAPDLSTLPGPLAPLAAFEGRRTASVHRFGDASVTLTITKGILRAVAAERPAGRILLSGDPQAVRAAAILIAESIEAAIPLASLAAEGIALATGRPAAPRRAGPAVLPDGMTSVPEALAYITGHLTDAILADAPHANQPGTIGVEAVHRMRVAVRRARSALSVFRPAVEESALATIDTRLRTLGHQLGPTRDWDVFVEETLPAIREALPGDERLERLASAAVRRRKEHRASLAAYLGSRAFTISAIELAWFAAGAGTWQVTNETETIELPAFSAAVLRHRWKRLVAQGKRMEELDIPGLHGVRLRAKRARYAAEMFATLYPEKAAQRFIRRLSVLQQRLGVLNDGAVATQLLRELGGPSGRHAYAVGAIVGYLAARAGKVRPGIVRAFEKFRRLDAYWA